jgi:hypothetical protein
MTASTEGRSTRRTSFEIDGAPSISFLKAWLQPLISVKARIGDAPGCHVMPRQGHRLAA